MAQAAALTLVSVWISVRIWVLGTVAMRPGQRARCISPRRLGVPGWVAKSGIYKFRARRTLCALFHLAWPGNCRRRNPVLLQLCTSRSFPTGACPFDIAHATQNSERPKKQKKEEHGKMERERGEGSGEEKGEDSAQNVCSGALNDGLESAKGRWPSLELPALLALPALQTL
jgi:hypothetical protein